MLFKQPVLARIEAGDIEVAFRAWTRPTVKEGGTLTTPVGVLDILAVDRIEEEEITPEAARTAGYASLDELLSELRARPGGDLYRIRFRWRGPDPRKELREQTDLSGEEWSDLLGRLRRLDRASPTGPWTHLCLRVLKQHEGVRAGDLVPYLGREKAWVKRNVRKLKNLGLTISLGTGYRLSPRGRAVLHLLAESESLGDTDAQARGGPLGPA